MQNYLGKALEVLEKFNISFRDGEESHLANILQEAVHIDEPKVIAIARTVQHIGTFSQLVRDNVEGMDIAQRYNEITDKFDSIRDDSKRSIEQLADGKIDYKEKAGNLWMNLFRGSTHSRFKKISDLYNSVADDTKEQLKKEGEILDAYIDFRFALKESETLAYELLSTQENNLKSAQGSLQEASKNLENYTLDDKANKSRLEMKRDEAIQKQINEDKVYQLIKDVAEDLKNGYNVGEALIAKLQQTHNVKERVYQRAVSFFTTNEHVFTALDATYTSQQGLHETTQTLESMKTGINKGLEDIATLGTNIEKAALKAGYGSTYNPASVQKLIDSIVNYQIESREMISTLRKESSTATKEVETIVNNGKKRISEVIAKYDALEQRIN